ncbi:MAG TPA: mechanosensitive ion channel family protein [Saprospiraceae bacterium]|nr:mechanosensitive ion channel family protein [Saprospiraceae bacterium]HMQ83801.1 mechanosensitive ion channel family protein [Saprospiraceae bacterium]
MESFNIDMQQLTHDAIQYGTKLAIALLVLFIGFKLANRVARMAKKAMERLGLSENLLPFIGSLVGISLKVLLLLSAAAIMGLEMSSFVAILAAAGFAVGLALQGSLSNFAAGILILVFRPYKVGDWIEVEDRFGKVEEIQIFNTIIVTPGMKTLIIPNSHSINNIVTNYSSKGVVRLEIRVTMPYSESYPKVEQAIRKTLQSCHKLLEQPEPEVGIETYDSHNIVIVVRPYALPDDYWEATFEVNRKIKTTFHQCNIQIAYSEGIELGEIGD